MEGNIFLTSWTLRGKASSRKRKWQGWKKDGNTYQSFSAFLVYLLVLPPHFCPSCCAAFTIMSGGFHVSSVMVLSCGFSVAWELEKRILPNHALVSPHWTFQESLSFLESLQSMTWAIHLWMHRIINNFKNYTAVMPWIQTMHRCILSAYLVQLESIYWFYLLQWIIIASLCVYVQFFTN